MTNIQEASNSTTSVGKVGGPVQTVLNISGLQIISVLISADNSLTGNSYDVYVSNNSTTWHYLRSIQLQGNITTNSFTPFNQGVFATPTSFNFIKILVPAIPDTTSSIVISAR